MLTVFLKNKMERGWFKGQDFSFPCSVGLGDVAKVEAVGEEREYCLKVLGSKNILPGQIEFFRNEAVCIVAHLLIDTENKRGKYVNSSISE